MRSESTRFRPPASAAALSMGADFEYASAGRRDDSMRSGAIESAKSSDSSRKCCVDAVAREEHKRAMNAGDSSSADASKRKAIFRERSKRRPQVKNRGEGSMQTPLFSGKDVRCRPRCRRSFRASRLWFTAESTPDQKASQRFPMDLSSSPTKDMEACTDSTQKSLTRGDGVASLAATILAGSCPKVFAPLSCHLLRMAAAKR